MALNDAWTVVTTNNPAGLLMKYFLAEPEYANGTGMDGYSSLRVDVMARTPVPAFFNQLCGYGLPFRVNVKVAAQFHIPTDEEPRTSHFSLPSWTVEPAFAGGIHNWLAFRLAVMTALEYKIEVIEGLPSSVLFTGLDELTFTFVPMDNLAAFQHHLPGLVGGCKNVKLPEVLHAKRCCLSIQNEDQQCFRCCIISHVLGIYREDNSARWALYLKNARTRGPKPKGWEPVYKDCGIDFSSLPIDRGSTTDDIEQLEKDNENLAIYVFTWVVCTGEHKTQGFPVLYRLPPPGRMTRSMEIVLLHHKDHWFLVTNFQALMGQQGNEIQAYGCTNTRQTCHRCLQNCDGFVNLEKHMQKCRGLHADVVECPARLPSLDNPKDKCVSKFTAHKKTLALNVVGVYDFETYKTAVDLRMGSTRVRSENNSIASIGFHIQGVDLDIPEEFQAQILRDNGDEQEVFTEFFKAICRILLWWQDVRSRQENIAMTPAAWKRFKAAQVCEDCQQPFKDASSKCRDHDHITKAYRSALCKSCNNKKKIQNVLPLFAHNATNYDNHFVIRGLSRLQGGPCGHMGIHELAGLPLPDDHVDVPVSKWQAPNIIASSKEKFKTITFCIGNMKVRFGDSIAFLGRGLDALMKSSVKTFRDDLSSGYPTMTDFHPCVADLRNTADKTAMLKKLVRKIPFPYSFMVDSSCWDTYMADVPREAFYNDFTKEHISDEDWGFMRHLCQACDVISFRDYHDIYLHTDVLVLNDEFHRFRTAFHATLGVDPAHYLGIPSAALDALLKGTEAEIQLITVESADGQGQQLMNDVNANIRGGLSCIFTPIATANNPLCREYIPCDSAEHTWIIDTDATSLYPYCMTMPLPIGDYQKETRFDGCTPEVGLEMLHKLLDEYTPDSNRGYMVIVDFHVPKDKHDDLDFAPVSSRSVDWSELSMRQRLVKRLKLTQKDVNADRRRTRHQLSKDLARAMKQGGKKLVPDLGHRTQGIHVEYAQQLRKLGVVFTAVHKVWSYEQSCVFKEFIEARAKERGATTNESTSIILKMFLVSTFGKMLENKKDHRTIVVHTDPVKFQRAVSKTRMIKQKSPFEWMNAKTYRDGTTEFLGLTYHTRRGGVCLDTPRMIGWAMLDYAKTVMLRFHYDVMKPCFSDLRLLITDTDSLIYLIRSTVDPVETMRAHNLSNGEFAVFDLSAFSRFKDCQNAKKLGNFKVECGDNTLEALAAACAKCYCKKTAEEEICKYKGVPKGAVKRLYGYDSFTKAILTTETQQAEFLAFRSVDHVVRHCDVTRAGLTTDNDKVFLLSPGASRPLGHYKNHVVPIPACPEWDLVDSDEELYVMATAALPLVEGEQDCEPELGDDDDDAATVVDAE